MDRSERRRPAPTRRPWSWSWSAVAILVAVLASTTVACSSDERPPPKGATTVTTGGVLVNAIVRPPSQSATGTDELVTVLFLHGKAYDSRIWDDRGLLNAVSTRAGFRAVAVDLPGYGDTPKRPEGSGADPISDGTWLRGLIEELGGPTHVVVVSPSMSGAYSLGYLEEHPKDALLGFVPVAPVGIDEFERPTDAAPIPTLSVWGSKDPSYTKARADHLIEQMRAPEGKATTEVIEGAGHACYDDEPGEFTTLLLSFLRSLGS